MSSMSTKCCFHMRNACACRNDNQINNRLVILLSRDGRERAVYWKDVVAGDLIKVGQEQWLYLGHCAPQAAAAKTSQHQPVVLCAAHVPFESTADIYTAVMPPQAPQQCMCVRCF